MRNIFLLLLLANICLGLWVYTQEKSVAEVVQPQQPNPISKSLVLLSELPASEILQAKVEPAALPSDIEPPVVVELQQEPETPLQQECFTLGPFSSAAKSKRALRLLAAAGAQAGKRENQEQVPYGYRVFIPPLSSREQAYRVAEQLRDSGIKDYFVISNPNDKLNGVSLGLFKKRTGAIKRVAQMRNMEYQASIEVRYKDKAIYWVDYSADIGLVGAQVLLEAGEGVAGMQHLARDCSGIV